MYFKKKAAIKSLSLLKDKLEKGDHSSNWYSALMDTIYKYIGKGQLYNQAKQGYLYANEKSTADKIEADQLVKYAIQYIEVNGVKKGNSIFRYLEGIDQRVLWGAFITFCGLVFGFGRQCGKVDQTNNQLKLENKALREKLKAVSINPTLSVPKEPADTNTSNHSN